MSSTTSLCKKRRRSAAYIVAGAAPQHYNYGVMGNGAYPYGLKRIPTEIHDFCTELLLYVEEAVRARAREHADAASGYGVEFRNDVFSMRPFWWEEESAPEAGEANFHHFASDTKIYWQRRIGQGMVTNAELSKEAFFEIVVACCRSLRA